MKYSYMKAAAKYEEKEAINVGCVWRLAKWLMKADYEMAAGLSYIRKSGYHLPDS